MLSIETGVISTTKKVQIPIDHISLFLPLENTASHSQLVAVANAAARVRMARGAYSAGTVKDISIVITCES